MDMDYLRIGCVALRPCGSALKAPPAALAMNDQGRASSAFLVGAPLHPFGEAFIQLPALSGGETVVRQVVEQAFELLDAQLPGPRQFKQVVTINRRPGRYDRRLGWRNGGLRARLAAFCGTALGNLAVALARTGLGRPGSAFWRGGCRSNRSAKVGFSVVGWRAGVLTTLRTLTGWRIGGRQSAP